MDDAWNTPLWDILPQDVGIAGVGHDDSIILDGCRAANVRWKSFTPVANTRRATWRRTLAQIALRTSGFVFLIATILVSIYRPVATQTAFGVPIAVATSPLFILGVVLIVYSLLLMVLSPWLLRIIYLGKLWDQQCWLFGFEGYLPIETIEYQIFGGRMGRLRWTPFSSPLSRHHRNAHGECVPDDPTSDPAVRALVEKCKAAGPGDQRLFTLVDTGSMSVTLFTAERPPTCFLMAGSEGGMKRVIGCSYDWTTATMFRETVLRMETRFEDAMSRVGRVKIGFKRAPYPTAPLGQVGEASGERMKK